MNRADITNANIIIVDDDDGTRTALEALLQSAGYQCHCHASGEAFLATSLPPLPRCLVLDLNLGGQSGLDVQRAVNRRKETLPILFLTGDASAAHAVRALKAGALDFLEKPFDPEVLLRRIEQALYVSADVSAHKASLQHDEDLLTSLTAREHEILALLVNGNLNREVATKLDISTRTVESHRTHIMEKLRARTLADLARIWWHAQPS